MGLVYTNIILANPRKPELKSIEVKALVDTGAIVMCVPEHIATQLQLDILEKREIEIADGSAKNVPYAGPLTIKFENRSSFGGAMIMGNEVLLGAIQMEDMDLVVIPREQKLIVNPLNPNFAKMKIK